MKKWLSILLIVILIITLSACGKKSTESSGEQLDQHPSDITEPKDSEGEDQVTDTLNSTDNETDNTDGQSEPVPDGDEVSGNSEADGNGTDSENDSNDASDDAEIGNVPTELDSTDEVVIEIGEDEGVGDF